MSQRILFPGFNELSDQQKEVVRKWIALLMDFKLATQELVDFLDVEKDGLEPSLIHDQKTQKSVSTVSIQVEDSMEAVEGLRIENLIPFLMLSKKEEKPPEGWEEFICRLKCWREGRIECNC